MVTKTVNEFMIKSLESPCDLSLTNRCIDENLFSEHPEIFGMSEKINKAEILVTLVDRNDLVRVGKFVSQVQGVVEYGSPSLISSATHGHFEILKFLIESGVNVLDVIPVYKEEEVSPASEAASAGHLNCLKLLVENGADPFDCDGLNHAIVYEHHEVIEYILSEENEKHCNESFLWRGVEAVVRSGNVYGFDKILSLLKTIEESSWFQQELMRHLRVAISFNFPNVVVAAFGNEVYAAISSEALTCAAKRGEYDLIEPLINHGAKVVWKLDNGECFDSLSKAAEYKNYEFLVKLLTYSDLPSIQHATQHLKSSASKEVYNGFIEIVNSLKLESEMVSQAQVLDVNSEHEEQVIANSI